MDCTQLRELVKSVDVLSPNVENFYCTKCQQLALDPRRSRCGHLFCAFCVGQLAPSGTMICPIDHSLIKNAEIYEDIQAKIHVVKILISCPNKKYGCKQSGYIEQMPKHVDQCQYFGIQCPQGCKTMIGSLSFAVHLQNLCTHRHISCKYCSVDVVFYRFEEHLKECYQFPIQCPYRCNQVFLPREQMVLHITRCPSKPVECKYAEAGCTFRGTELQVHHHQMDVQGHMDIIFGQSQRQLACFELTIMGMKTEIANLQNENWILKDSVEQNKELMDVSKIHIEKLTKKVVNLQKSVLNYNMQVNILKDRNITTVRGVRSDDNFETIVNQNTDNELEGQKGQMEKGIQESLDKLDLHDVKLVNLEQRIHKIESTSHDGILIWKISDFDKRKQDAIDHKTTSIYSAPFYTARFGYKLCLRMYPNGSKSGKNHVSLFLSLMKGQMDSIMNWPFCSKITLMILDQSGPFKAYTQHYATNSKPSAETIIIAGSSTFISHQVLEKTRDRYLVNDTMYIKVKVEVAASNLHQGLL